MTYLDVSESYIRPGHWLYSVIDDKVYKVYKVESGKIYFENNKSYLILKDKYVELSKTKISFFGFYLVPKYEIAKSKIITPELWI